MQGSPGPLSGWEGDTLQHSKPRSSRLRLLAAVPAAALIATGLTIAGADAANSDGHPRYRPADADYYINYVDPKVQPSTSGKEVKLGTTKDGKPIYGPARASAADYGKKFAEGNPRAARVLAKQEQQAMKTGKNPSEFRYKNAKQTQVAKLLTILVEFNPNANDDFTGTMVAGAVFDDDLTPNVNERACVPGTIQNGPTHNNIPNPADLAHEDNNSMWVPDFSSEFYNKLLYSTEGWTARVRPDLKGPDGQPGISLAGYTMHNMYTEMSKGRYTVDGEATPWVQVHTLRRGTAWTPASRCHPACGRPVPNRTTTVTRITRPDLRLSASTR